MEVPVQGTQPRGRLLTLLRHDGLLAEGAAGRLFPELVTTSQPFSSEPPPQPHPSHLILAPVVGAVDVALVIRDEGDVDHVALAHDADEALRVEGTAGRLDHLAADLLLALGAFVALLLAAGLAEDLIVHCVIGAGDGLAALVAFLSVFLKQRSTFSRCGTILIRSALIQSNEVLYMVT